MVGPPCRLPDFLLRRRFTPAASPSAQPLARASSRISAMAFSPIIVVGALVRPACPQTRRARD
jgi:hypothetical protein